MHKNFGEWYRLVSIQHNDDVLGKRWGGIQEWASTLWDDDDSLLETVRIFQGLPEKTSREKFLEAFRKHDAAFPQRNELEQRVLAGAALVHCADLENDGNEESDPIRTGIIAGTAVEASSLLVLEPPLSEITKEILAGLDAIAEDQSMRLPFQASKIGKQAKVATKAFGEIPAVSNWDQFKSQFVPVLEGIVGALNECQEALAAAEQNIRCSDQEINILWWLEGACSRDLNAPWRNLPKDAVPFIAGTELADITDNVLDPQAAAAFLDRIVTKVEAKPTQFQNYVNAVPADWLKARPDVGRGLDLAPLSLALSHRRNSNSSSWMEFFGASTGMEVSRIFAPAFVARQAYLEAVLLDALGASEE